MAEKNEQNVRASGPFTGIEHSDGRLAAAEEAKRTGLEFRSTSAEGVDLVQYTTAVEAGNEWSNELVAEDDALGDELASETKSVTELNEMKAKAHEDYSNGVLRRRADNRRMETGERVEAITKRNDQIQTQHEEQSNEVADRAKSGEERVPLRAEQLEDDAPVTLLGQQAVKQSVTNISESEEREMFKDKGRVMYGEVPFEAFVDEEASRKESRTEERDVPQPHQAGDLASGKARSAGKGQGKQESSEDKDVAKAQREAEKAEREEARERQKAEREQRKAEEKARREEEKQQREAAASAENTSGESQE